MFRKIKKLGSKAKAAYKSTGQQMGGDVGFEAALLSYQADLDLQAKVLKGRVDRGVGIDIADQPKKLAKIAELVELSKAITEYMTEEGRGNLVNRYLVGLKEKLRESQSVLSSQKDPGESSKTMAGIAKLIQQREEAHTNFKLKIKEAVTSGIDGEIARLEKARDAKGVTVKRIVHDAKIEILKQFKNDLKTADPTGKFEGGTKIEAAITAIQKCSDKLNADKSWLALKTSGDTVKFANTLLKAAKAEKLCRPLDKERVEEEKAASREASVSRASASQHEEEEVGDEEREQKHEHGPDF